MTGKQKEGNGKKDNVQKSTGTLMGAFRAAQLRKAQTEGPVQTPQEDEGLSLRRGATIPGVKPRAPDEKRDEKEKYAIDVMHTLTSMYDNMSKNPEEFSVDKVVDKIESAYFQIMGVESDASRARLLGMLASKTARFGRTFNNANLIAEAKAKFDESVELANSGGYQRELKQIEDAMARHGMAETQRVGEPVAKPIPLQTTPEEEELARKQLDEVKDLAIAKKYDKALDEANKIKIAGIRHKAYEKIADAYASEEKFSDALDIAKKIKKEDSLFYARVVMEIARDYQTKTKNNQNTLDGEKTLEKALKAAENAADTAKHTDPRYTIESKNEWIQEIKKEQTELNAKIDGAPTLRKLRQRRTRNKYIKWITSAVGFATTVIAIPFLIEYASRQLLDDNGGKSKSELAAEQKPPYVTMVGGLAKETAGEVTALENVDERILEEGGYAELINPGIDVDKLKHRLKRLEDLDTEIKDVEEALEGKRPEVAAYVTKVYLQKKLKKLEKELEKAKATRDEDEIEKDIDKVKKDIERISELEKLDEGSKLEKLKAKLEKLEKLEAELADAALSRNVMEVETEIENVKKALEEGEGGKFFVSFEKEALEELKKELQEERAEAEKMHKYLGSKDVFNKILWSNCPVSETTGAQVGNGSCDNYVYARFEGKDGKTMWLRIPYNERDILVDENGNPVLLNGKKQKICEVDCKTVKVAKRKKTGVAD